MKEVLPRKILYKACSYRGAGPRVYFSIQSPRFGISRLLHVVFRAPHTDVRGACFKIGPSGGFVAACLVVENTRQLTRFRSVKCYFEAHECTPATPKSPDLSDVVLLAA